MFTKLLEVSNKNLTQSFESILNGVSYQSRSFRIVRSFEIVEAGKKLFEFRTKKFGQNYTDGEFLFLLAPVDGKNLKRVLNKTRLQQMPCRPWHVDQGCPINVSWSEGEKFCNNSIKIYLRNRLKVK